MKSIEALVIVTPDGKLDVQAQEPVDITPGEYRSVLKIDEQPTNGKKDKFEFPLHDVGPWPENLSLRREDMYDEWGR